LSHTYAYARPALTVDTVVFGYGGAALQVLLIERGLAPFKGCWALPGGFVRMDETLDESARRELHEETGLADVYLEQLYTFGDLRRDPRERVVSVAYFALVKLADHRVSAATDARAAAWFGVDRLPTLAFDHAQIIATALERLRGKVRYRPIGFELLPERFPLRDLQNLYEAVLGGPLDKRNFRKKVLGMGLLKELDETEQDVSHRAARLYKFDEKAYRRLAKQGFEFSL
jgi:8-oxo-dGTP diphosphatase